MLPGMNEPNLDTGKACEATRALGQAAWVRIRLAGGGSAFTVQLRRACLPVHIRFNCDLEGVLHLPGPAVAGRYRPRYTARLAALIGGANLAPLCQVTIADVDGNQQVLPPLGPAARSRVLPPVWQPATSRHFSRLLPGWSLHAAAAPCPRGREWFIPQLFAGSRHRLVNIFVLLHWTANDLRDLLRCTADPNLGDFVVCANRYGALDGADVPRSARLSWFFNRPGDRTLAKAVSQLVAARPPPLRARTTR